MKEWLNRAAALLEASLARPRHELNELDCFLMDGVDSVGTPVAKVRLAIEDLLDDGLPRAYSKEMFAAKVDAVFDPVYRSYGGEGDSVFKSTS